MTRKPTSGQTDPSYTPELRGYLTQLLADRERIAAAPSEEEIDAVRRLLRASDEVLAGLDDDDRAAVQAACGVPKVCLACELRRWPGQR